MNAAAQQPFQSRTDNAGAVRAFVLAAIVHGLLFGFLYYGISWQNAPREVSVADLYGELPSAAAPPPKPVPVMEPAPQPPKIEPEPQPEPAPPPPVQPAIRIKEPEPPKKKPLPPKEVKPTPPKEIKPVPRAPERPKDPFQSELDKELSKLKSNDVAASAGKELAQRQSNVAGGAKGGWIDQIRTRIRGNFRFPQDVPGNPTATFDVTLYPSGEIRSLVLRKSSGNTALDSSMETAIRNTQPFPRAPDSVSKRDREELQITLQYADLK